MSSGVGAHPLDSSPAVFVRPVRAEDEAGWVRMRTALWPEAPEDHPREVADYLAEPRDDAMCLVAEVRGGGLAGFAEMGVRRYAEGCRTSPVAYLEGIWVEPGARGGGVGRSLVHAAAEWARKGGYEELASDRAVENEVSGAFHAGVGFQEAGRIVCYRMSL